MQLTDCQGGVGRHLILWEEPPCRGQVLQGQVIRISTTSVVLQKGGWWPCWAVARVHRTTKGTSQHAPCCKTRRSSDVLQTVLRNMSLVAKKFLQHGPCCKRNHNTWPLDRADPTARDPTYIYKRSIDRRIEQPKVNRPYIFQTYYTQGQFDTIVGMISQGLYCGPLQMKPCLSLSLLSLIVHKSYGR